MTQAQKREARWLNAAHRIGMGEVTTLPGSHGKIRPEWERVSVDRGLIGGGKSPGELECYDGRWRDPLGTEREVRAIIATVGDEKKVVYFGGDRPEGALPCSREDAVWRAMEWARSRKQEAS